MSTRSVIARKTTTGFKGVYHHWDGYPSGLGATLFELRKTHFKANTDAMLKFLIDQHPAGWSTINGANFNLPAGPRVDSNLQICSECYRPAWLHYSQYYRETSEYWVAAGRPPLPKIANGEVCVFGHSAKPVETPHGPECFPDSEACTMTEDNASGSGCEYAYVFDGNGTMEIQSSYRDTGQKMIGMFGCGDENAKWRTIATVNLDGDEPNWEKLN